MKVLIQRVRSAGVMIAGQSVATIGPGMLVLLGVTHTDTTDTVARMVRKIARLRIFDDDAGVMNLSLLDTGRDALVVSQFTLMASTAKGNRPSYVAAAPPEISRPLYEEFCRSLSAELGRPVPTGRFGADMQVGLINDGPVTIMLDSAEWK